MRSTPASTGSFASGFIETPAPGASPAARTASRTRAIARYCSSLTAPWLRPIRLAIASCVKSWPNRSARTLRCRQLPRRERDPAHPVAPSDEFLDRAGRGQVMVLVDALDEVPALPPLVHDRVRGDPAQPRGEPSAVGLVALDRLPRPHEDPRLSDPRRLRVAESGAGEPVDGAAVALVQPAERLRVLFRAHYEVALLEEIEAINDRLTGPGARPQVRAPILGGSPCYLGCVERSEAASHLDVRRVAVRRPSPALRRRAESQLR